MTRERAKRLAEQWSKGMVCTLREGEAEEYHKLCLSAIRAHQEPQWISVTVRLPYHLQTVIALHKNGNIDVEEYRALALLNSFSRENFYGPVTHWMPMPEPPEEE